eukprot:SAG31_NODE_7089_length_1791_cov_17.291371_1_plen_29_part_10
MSDNNSSTEPTESMEDLMLRKQRLADHAA